jgi:hypothetical protein
MPPRWEPDPDVRRGRSVVHILRAHLVFTPKYRRGPFTDEILARCEEIMTEVCTDFDAVLREFNGDTDHVHLIVHYPPKVALSRLVNSLKRGLRAPPAPRIPRPHPQIPVGQALLVPVLLRRILRRRSTSGGQGLYREPETPHLAKFAAPRAATTNGMRFLPAVNDRVPRKNTAESLEVSRTATRNIGDLGLAGQCSRLGPNGIGR